MRFLLRRTTIRSLLRVIFGIRSLIDNISRNLSIALLFPSLWNRFIDGCCEYFVVSNQLRLEHFAYWRDLAQQLLSDPETPDDSSVRKAYAHMAQAQANLFANHNLNDQAEQAYRVATHFGLAIAKFWAALRITYPRRPHGRSESTAR